MTISRLLLILNLCVWIYFWWGFSHAAYPFQRNPYGHASGTGYTFWGYSIGIAESPFAHQFFVLMFWINLPAFACVLLTGHAVLPYAFSEGLYAGLSEDAWLLLLVMGLSFFQWYAIGRLLGKVYRRLW